ncbi:hypothetical protein ONZ51_g12944 [Trametes cubensis]|uniref:Uncharacterized protein n=1 Tax=Trametes cubensis TaxID=1111947 RepID=A0AAD7THE9_9APHY|nr:hypothetical protein ONZ51_g12944 [Trametes cubensis]
MQLRDLTYIGDAMIEEWTARGRSLPLLIPLGPGSRLSLRTCCKTGTSGTGSQQLVIQLPSGTKCSGGASKDKCLASFTTAGGFGNCVVVQQSAGSASGNDAQASTASSAATPSAASSTAPAASASASAKGKGSKGKSKEQIEEEILKELQQLEKELSQNVSQRDLRPLNSRATRSFGRAQEFA